MSCEHTSFKADVRVARLSDVDGGPVTGYTCDLAVRCATCGMPFRFIGVPPTLRLGGNGTYVADLKPDGPRTSYDATELRAPIEPCAAGRPA